MVVGRGAMWLTIVTLEMMSKLSRSCRSRVEAADPAMYWCTTGAFIVTSLDQIVGEPMALCLLYMLVGFVFGS